MVLLCKQKALYVKCCIIANGVTDSQGDTLYAEDIKKIFTSFNNQDNFEIYHDELPLQEVSLLENYISTADETIGTAVVPSGSWNAVVRVDNPEIKDKLLTNELKGVSLNNRIAEACQKNLHGTVRYKDIADTECVIPLFISFVKGGANGYGLHVMDYDAYILKSKDVEVNKGAKKMAFDWKGELKKLVQRAEADEEPIIIKDDSTNKEEKEDEAVEEPTAKNESSEPTIKKSDDSEEDEDDKKEDEEDPSIEKDDETEPESDDEFEAKVTAIVKKVLAEMEAETGDKTDDESSEDETSDEAAPKIVKSRKVIDDTQSTPIQNINYYTISGRDPVTGKKIRN